MELFLPREPTIKESTYGILYVDKHFFCHTLEDAIREPNPIDYNIHAFSSLEDWVKSWKIYGKTAIPEGKYKVTLEQFKNIGLRPYLHDVPGFEGIFIHGGADIDDTLGCPLVGNYRLNGRLSGYIIPELVDVIAKATDEVTIEVLNP